MKKKIEHSETWTVTVELTVMAGDMKKADVMAVAERLLPDLLDGTDFMGISIINAKRDF